MFPRMGELGLRISCLRKSLKIIKKLYKFEYVPVWIQLKMTAFVRSCFEVNVRREILHLVFVKFGAILIRPEACR